MTMALCFDCGNIKFGAICPCPNCGTSSTGNIELDILFSDHRFRVETLEQAGEIIRRLRQASDHETAFWTFLHYISLCHPHVLTVTLQESMLERANDLLKSVELPPVDFTTHADPIVT